LISGEAFFVTDNNPVNNVLFFLEPILPAVCKNPVIPSLRIPVSVRECTLRCPHQDSSLTVKTEILAFSLSFFQSQEKIKRGLGE
jgi:hypothetical protein